MFHIFHSYSWSEPKVFVARSRNGGERDVLAQRGTCRKPDCGYVTIRRVR